jgi:hypothetical protein
LSASWTNVRSLIVITCVLAGTSLQISHAAPVATVESEARSRGGIHGLRFGVGFSLATTRFGAVVIIDPWYLVGSQMTTDLLARVSVIQDLEITGGLRNQIVALASGFRVYESLLVGVTTPLHWSAGKLQLRAGAQFTTLMVSHGGGFPTQSISLQRATTSFEIYSFEMLVQARYSL